MPDTYTFTVTTDGFIQIMGSNRVILMEDVTTQTHGVNARQCAHQIIESRLYNFHPSLLQELRASSTPCLFCNAMCSQVIPQLNICEVDAETHQYTFHVMMCPTCMCINCENQAMAAMEDMRTSVQHLFESPEASTHPDTTAAEEYHGQGNTYPLNDDEEEGNTYPLNDEEEEEEVPMDQLGRACMEAIRATPY